MRPFKPFYISALLLLGALPAACDPVVWYNSAPRGYGAAPYSEKARHVGEARAVEFPGQRAPAAPAYAATPAYSTPAQAAYGAAPAPAAQYNNPFMSILYSDTPTGATAAPVLNDSGWVETSPGVFTPRSNAGYN